MTNDEIIRRIQLARMLFNNLEEALTPAVGECISSADLRRTLDGDAYKLLMVVDLALRDLSNVFPRFETEVKKVLKR